MVLRRAVRVQQIIQAGDITDLGIRPDIRYDWSLNGTRPFNDSSDQEILTAAMDVVLTF